MKKLDQKLLILLLMIAASVCTIGTTYAYMSAYVSGSANTNVDLNSGITESLTFKQGDSIAINAKASNFGEGSGSLSADTNITAKLVKDSTKASATQKYNLYFDITKNNFEYSHNSSTPELVLSITDPNGNAVDNLLGLNYVTVTDVKTNENISGFDVTTHEGLIKIVEDYEISTTENFEEQEWIIKLTFVNLSTDQSVNKGKEFESNTVISNNKLQFQMVSGAEFNNAIGELRSEIDEIYFHDTKSGNYESALIKWDFSELDNSEEVVGYIEEKDGKQILHIEAENTIQMHENMGGNCNTSINEYNALFCHFSSVTVYDFNSSIDTSNVKNMSYLFSGNISLIDLNLNSFDTSSVVFLDFMLDNCNNLINLNINNFDTSNVTSLRGMFSHNHSLKSLNLNHFNTSNVTDFGWLFYNTHNLTNLDIANFDTSNATLMDVMFWGAKSLSSLNLSHFDTSKVTNMRGMFRDMTVLTDLNISVFNTVNVTNMDSMFSLCESIVTLDLSSFDTSNVTTMKNMFHRNIKLINLDISSFNTVNVIDFGWMFYNCYELNSLNLLNFNTSNALYMDVMFWGANNLTMLNLVSFDTSNVVNMRGMFAYMTNISLLDLSSFDVSNVENTDDMFTNTNSTTNYAKTQSDANILNLSLNKPESLIFVVKP